MPPLPWVSSRTLFFTAQGKFQLDFPAECPLLVHFFEFSSDHCLTPSFHDHLEISYVFEGKGYFHVENKLYEFTTGDLLLVGNQEFHLIQAHPGRKARVISLHFMPELVHRGGGSPLDFEYLRPFFFRGSSFSNLIPAAALPDQTIKPWLLKIHMEIQSGARDYPLAVKTLLLNILLLLARHYNLQDTRPARKEQRQGDFERLRPVFDFLKANYQEELTLEKIAAIAGMTPTYFCRFFRKVTGKTLTEYLLCLRVDKGMELLLNSSQSVTEIAYAVGFGSHSYFDRVFCWLTGRAPLEFRKTADASPRS